MRKIITNLFAIFLLLTSAAHGAEVNNELYASVLQKYVKNGLVDYAVLKANRDELDAYLEMMGQIEPGALSRNEQLAFYINLYNAATIRLIVDHYPVESIKDVGSFFSSPWKKKVVNLNGEMVTLDNIEHDIVRPVFKDNRVHFALNCSAISCPPLLGMPYDASMVDAQLEEVTLKFINDAKSNYLEGNTLYVSKIFSWFSEDFPDDFVDWFVRFAQGEIKRELEIHREAGEKVRVKYLQYDWSLNELPR